MGKVIMITGAAGFIGRHCVKCARERGHTVIAVVRSQAGVIANWQSDPMIEVVVSDLAEGANPQLVDAAKRAEAIIHTAAALAGDDAQQARDTVLATKTLLHAMEAIPRQNRKLILVSSIAVYDAAGLQENAVLDERTPLEANPDKRDAYCRNKHLQETAALQTARSNKLDLFIMRPGAVFGPGRLWNAHLGHALGPILLRLGSKGQVPVSHVNHCAKALVLAAETPLSGVEVINVVDDDLPDRKTYIQALRTTGWPRIVIPMSWRFLVGLGNICARIPNLPGLLRPVIIKSRMMPLRYSNEKLKKQLGWQADIPFEKAMKRAISAENRGAL
jgi:nucleoside-diphosphate-sugar epimerase